MRVLEYERKENGVMWYDERKDTVETAIEKYKKYIEEKKNGPK